MQSASEVTALRLRMLEAGYVPVPLNGKIPVLPAWQKKLIGPDDIRKWEAEFAGAHNTGATCRGMPTFDIDVRDPEAAAAVENLVRKRFEESGKILVRTGEAPKRAILFRTDSPFVKKLALLDPPNGSKKQRIEFLGEGQQVVCFGTHPDTHKPYHWFGGEPGSVPIQDLPHVDQSEAQRLITDAIILLTGEYGYTLASSDDADAGHNSKKSPVDVEAEVARMTPDNVNDVHIRIIPAMIWRGMHPDDILKQVTTWTMGMAASYGKTGWSKRREAEKFVVKRVSSALKNLFMAEYDPTTGTLPSWLCADFHRAWIDALAAGKEPRIGRNASGFYIGAYDPKADEKATASAKDGADTSAKESASIATKKSSLFIIRPFAPFDPASLPPRQWLYGRHYLRRAVSCTTAPGGFGKSSLDMVESIAMATCRNLLGEQPAERLRVWYHNGEDSYEELKRRLAAICQHYGIPQQELVDWFFMTSGTEVPLRVAEGYNKLELNRGLIKCINNQIEENQIDAVTLDPLITLHGVPESDNTKMDGVIRIFAGIADAHDCAIEISHHMRKPAAGSNGDYGVSDIRGASAIHDAVRSARILNRMSEKDMGDLGLQEHDRAKYFRVDKAKGNYSPAIKAVWRQFINIELPNGDDVGVVAPWNYPGQGEATPERQEQERTADFVFLQLIDRFTLEGRIVSERSGRNYAPALFAEEAEAKMAKLSRVTLKAAMLRLFKIGKIKAVDEGSGGKATHKIVRA